MKWRLGVVFVALASVALVATTFADWYLVTADGRGMFQSDRHFLRAVMSPWEQDRPRAIALVLVALACTVASVLGETKKLSDRTAALVVTGASLVAVGVFVARMAGEHTADLMLMTVRIQYLTGFYLAAGSAAALLLGAALHLVRLGYRTGEAETS